MVQDDYACWSKRWSQVRLFNVPAATRSPNGVKSGCNAGTSERERRGERELNLNRADGCEHAKASYERLGRAWRAVCGDTAAGTVERGRHPPDRPSFRTN
jgi:hypothetical protein